MKQVYTENRIEIEFPDELGSYVVDNGSAFYQVQIISLMFEQGSLEPPGKAIYIVIDGEYIRLEEYVEEYNCRWFEAYSYSVAELLEL